MSFGASGPKSEPSMSALKEQEYFHSFKGSLEGTKFRFYFIIKYLRQKCNFILQFCVFRYLSI